MGGNSKDRIIQIFMPEIETIFGLGESGVVYQLITTDMVSRENNQTSGGETGRTLSYIWQEIIDSPERWMG